MRTRSFSRSIVWAVYFSLLGSLMLPSVSQAKTAHEIDASVNAALDRFMKQVRGSRGPPCSRAPPIHQRPPANRSRPGSPEEPCPAGTPG